ncbi:GNAT family N-acetyltransferase [Chryseolinea lacunae]|uniref:GNAT family N-acetyltransferase n=1 Tax=Chryseolinea lacunae TaxID=2801331 RepID=A0ABS1KTV7_9BACT|nr:GNAT family N-acetyltransferase [Chryseolinea lacunae]MBL0742697.1 GNAT family N-acetyltransferase [Chryseolinea lacunae]
MEIVYATNRMPTPAQVIELYTQANLPRPTHDVTRMQQMFDNSNLVITAWHGDMLAGVCRCVTDWVWCCYLADLAVSPVHKKSGIGKKMISLTKELVGEQSMILLLSVPDAMEYYPKVGFTKENRGFILNRTQ